MIRAKFEDGKLPIPQNIIQKAGLKEGDEVEVGLEDGIVIIKPLIDKEKFVNELKKICSAEMVLCDREKVIYSTLPSLAPAPASATTAR